jgi:hypothetical protein
MAASKRMIGNWRATCRIVWMTASRTSALQVVELRRVVPGHAGAVVAVVDVADVAGPGVGTLEYDGRVRGVPVVILDLDRDPLVVGQVAAGERVRRVGRVGQLQEPVRMLDDPARVDAHVVGHHVRAEADAARGAAAAQLLERLLAAQVVGDRVVHQRVGGGRGLGVAAPLLDALLARLRSHRPISQRPVKPRRQSVELFVRDLVQAADPAAVSLRELVEPDIGGLGHQHDARHPVAILAEALVLVLDATQAGAVGGHRVRAWDASASTARLLPRGGRPG